MTSGSAVVRVDATTAIGGGHVYRCLALADALAAKGWTITFTGHPETPGVAPPLGDSAYEFVALESGTDDEATQMGRLFPSGAGLLVVDHYGWDQNAEAACRAWASRVLVVDDLANREHDCDFLLDQTLGRQADDYAALVPPQCGLLLGPEYALLRPEFAAAREKALERRGRDELATRIFINMGATDEYNVTTMVLDAVDGLGDGYRMDVVLTERAPHGDALVRRAARSEGSIQVHLGVGASDMAELLSVADIAIGAAGVATWERLCLGLPSVVVPVADNQFAIARALELSGAALVLVRNLDVTAEQIREAAKRLLADPRLRQSLSEIAAGICDGTGARRTAEHVSSLAAVSGNRAVGGT